MATLVGGAKERTAATSFPGLEAQTQLLSSVVLCTDDEEIESAVRYLRNLRTRDGDGLCLFTHYARLEDVMRAWQEGLLCYRRDGTIENAWLIVDTIIRTPWAAMIRPGEKLDGEHSKLMGRLADYPRGVADLLIECAGGLAEPRIVRPGVEGSQIEDTGGRFRSSKTGLG